MASVVGAAGTFVLTLPAVLVALLVVAIGIVAIGVAVAIAPMIVALDEAEGILDSVVGAVGDIPFADAFNTVGDLGVDPRLAAAVAKTESGFDPDVVNCTRRSSAGALGIMQFMPGTAEGMGIDPCDPNEAIPAGARYLKAQFDEFGSWELALAAYNAGPGAVRQHGGIPPFRETQDYVAKVMAEWQSYQQQFPVGSAVAGAAVQVVEVTAPDGSKIQVASTISDKVQALLEAAKRDGVPLSGGGYRSPEAQIELRRAHCGTSEHAIYEMPSSQCRPPTARPGESMHERGEAIDFTCSGALITSRSNSCYRWLDANASRYGLFELSCIDPSGACSGPEPWHFSTDAR